MLRIRDASVTSFLLQNNADLLDDESAKLESLGIRNNSQILLEGKTLGISIEITGLLVKVVAIDAGGLGSIPRPVKSDTVSPTVRHRGDVS